MFSHQPATQKPMPSVHTPPARALDPWALLNPALLRGLRWSLRRAGVAGLLAGMTLLAWANGPKGKAAPSAAPAKTHLNLQQVPLAQRAGVLAQALGRPRRMLVGVGATEPAAVLGQNLSPDLYDRYIVGVGKGAWPDWNQPKGAYLDIVIQDAEMVGAVPMFTLYQMAARGDGNLSGLTDPAFMGPYWQQVHLLFEKLGRYGRPVVVNLEPDFWGYAQQAQADPQRMAALVSLNPDCAQLPDNVVGMAQCLLRVARQLAPQAYVGFPPSLWVALTRTELSYMLKLGANEADFVVMQTLDRDAGCMEAQHHPHECSRNEPPWYWDEANAGSPNFKQHLARARYYFEGLQLPLLWWQTPMGVPASQPSKAPPWRDNRVKYFLTHPEELVAAGALGVVFGPGERNQTSLRTDGGQFKTLSKAYLAKPAPLP